VGVAGLISEAFEAIMQESTSALQQSYREGMDLYHGFTQTKDEEAGYQLIFKAASQGYAPAVIRYYLYGKVGHRAEALKLLRKGAEEGDPICCYLYLIECYQSSKVSHTFLLRCAGIAKAANLNVSIQQSYLSSFQPLS